jgi:hypothetical protein
MDFGSEISPARVMPVTRSPDSEATSTMMRRPFLRTIVSALAATANAQQAARHAIIGNKGLAPRFMSSF